MFQCKNAGMNSRTGLNTSPLVTESSYVDLLSFCCQNTNIKPKKILFSKGLKNTKVFQACSQLTLVQMLVVSKILATFVLCSQCFSVLS